MNKYEKRHDYIIFFFAVSQEFKILFSGNLF